jgi:hypothetical protein
MIADLRATIGFFWDITKFGSEQNEAREAMPV